MPTLGHVLPGGALGAGGLQAPGRLDDRQVWTLLLRLGHGGVAQRGGRRGDSPRLAVGAPAVAQPHGDRQVGPGLSGGAIQLDDQHLLLVRAEGADLDRQFLRRRGLAVEIGPDPAPLGDRVVVEQRGAHASRQAQRHRRALRDDRQQLAQLAPEEVGDLPRVLDEVEVAAPGLGQAAEQPLVEIGADAERARRHAAPPQLGRVAGQLARVGDADVGEAVGQQQAAGQLAAVQFGSHRRR